MAVLSLILSLLHKHKISVSNYLPYTAQWKLHWDESIFSLPSLSLPVINCFLFSSICIFHYFLFITLLFTLYLHISPPLNIYHFSLPLVFCLSMSTFISFSTLPVSLWLFYLSHTIFFFCSFTTYCLSYSFLLAYLKL